MQTLSSIHCGVGNSVYRSNAIFTEESGNRYIDLASLIDLTQTLYYWEVGKVHIRTDRRRTCELFREQGQLGGQSAGLEVERSRVRVRSNPVLPQQHFIDPGHSAKGAGGRLQLNTHVPFVCLFMKWHGTQLYGVHITRRGGSSFTCHQPCNNQTAL